MKFREHRGGILKMRKVTLFDAAMVLVTILCLILLVVMWRA